MDLERDDDAMSSVPDEIDADLRTVKRTWLANICCFFKFFGLLVTVLSAILAYADTAWISAEFKKDHPEMTDPIRAVVLAILAGVIAVIAFLTEYSIDKARTRILLWCADEIRKGGTKRQERAKSTRDDLEAKKDAKSNKPAKEAGASATAAQGEDAPEPTTTAAAAQGEDAPEPTTTAAAAQEEAKKATARMTPLGHRLYYGDLAKSLGVDLV